MSVFRSFEVLLGKKYKCVTKLSLKHQGRLKILCFTVTEQKSRKHESRRFTVMNTFDANMLPVTVQGGPPPPRSCLFGWNLVLLKVISRFLYCYRYKVINNIFNFFCSSFRLIILGSAPLLQQRQLCR